MLLFTRIPPRPTDNQPIQSIQDVQNLGSKLCVKDTDLYTRRACIRLFVGEAADWPRGSKLFPAETANAEH